MPVTALKKSPKRKALRYAEYYDLTAIFDELYAGSKAGKIFTNLLEIIASSDNILMAYREIKRNKGSSTAGTDKLTIRDLEKIPPNEFVQCIRKKLEWYKPKPVKRVEIPKANGKMRPLGIPSIWDRIVQQCILQVLEPICEARFHKRSNGFRPNRSTEHAIAQCMRMMQRQHLHYVVDIDIEGFFDHVDHTKLRKQMWAMGIRDKNLLCIITKMLKAPVVMPDKRVIFPKMGTPQGGVLSPLLSNIVLNELDWWIASQWEYMPLESITPQYNSNGGRNRGYECKVMRKTALKEMYIVRYADDFKIFCSKRSDADKIFIAVETWLKERLKLSISKEKSKVVNLKKSYTEFLGFRLKVVPKGEKYKVRSHLCDKAIRNTQEQLKILVKDMQHVKDDVELHQAVKRFNAIVIGKHQYFRIATCVFLDFDKIAWNINRAMKIRLKGRLKKTGERRDGYIMQNYGKSGQLRFLDGYPLVPIAYIQTKNALHLKRGACNYTEKGRAMIHKPLGVDLTILKALMLEEQTGCSIEFMDNRISLYAAQYGKCAITGVHLEKDEIHCHHRTAVRDGGSDRYNNLVIVHKNVHALLHATMPDTINKYLELIKPTQIQRNKIDNLRKLLKLDALPE